MHPLTEAYQVWLKSDQGEDCRDGSILKEPTLLRYLENRVYHAFHAGANAQLGIGAFPGKLKIVDETSSSFDQAVGLLSERSKELSRKMDELVKSYGQGPVRTCNVFNDIASFCESLEEMIYCTVVHCAWHAKRGFILA